MHKRSVGSTDPHLSLGTMSVNLVFPRLCSTLCGCQKEAHRSLETAAYTIESCRVTADNSADHRV